MTRDRTRDLQDQPDRFPLTELSRRQNNTSSGPNWDSEREEYDQRREEQRRDPGSNQGPSDLQSDALPTELSRLTREYQSRYWMGTVKF